MIYPIKLKRLHSQVLLEILPKKLVFRTPYLNSVRELMNIVQRLKALLYKDEDTGFEETSNPCFPKGDGTSDVRSVSKMYSLTGVKTPVSKFILPLKAGRLSSSRIFCKKLLLVRK